MQRLRTEELSGWIWYHQEATPDQRKLSDRIGELSGYFDDMRFQPGTHTHEMMKCKAYDEDAEEWEDYYLDPHDEIDYLDYAWFALTVKPLDDCGGYFDPEQQELCIPPESLDNDVAILHELIHLHEYVFDCAPSFYHDMAFWGLYTYLRARIPKLDEILSDHSCMLTLGTINETGGSHDILFLLKSFDLDIRKGLPLGTVFSYGKSDELKGYTYAAESSDCK